MNRSLPPYWIRYWGESNRGLKILVDLCGSQFSRAMKDPKLSIEALKGGVVQEIESLQVRYVDIGKGSSTLGARTTTIGLTRR